MPFNPMTSSRFRCVVDVDQHWQNILDRTVVGGKVVMLTASQDIDMLGVYVADGLTDNVSVIFRGWYKDPCEAIKVYNELAPENTYGRSLSQFKTEQKATAYEPA